MGHEFRQVALGFLPFVLSGCLSTLSEGARHVSSELAGKQTQFILQRRRWVMSFDKLLSAFSRLCFLGAFLLLVTAIVERFVNLFGYTILRGTYTGGRILEFAAVLIMFVIALTLREVRDALRK